MSDNRQFFSPLAEWQRGYYVSGIRSHCRGVWFGGKMKRKW